MTAAVDPWGDAEAEVAIEEAFQAEWSLRRIAMLRAHKTRLIEQHGKMVARYDEWLEAAAAPLQAQVDAEQERLKTWMLAQVEADPKGPKSISLPSGTVATRAGSTTVEIDDEKTFVEWALGAGGQARNMLRWPPPPAPKPDKGYIKAVLLEGELVPGVSLVEHPRTVTITTTPEGD